MPWTTGWYSQCIPMPYMVAPSSSGWLTIIRHMWHHSCSRITGWLELCSSSENPIWMGGAIAWMPATILCGFKFAGWPPDFCGWLFWKDQCKLTCIHTYMYTCITHNYFMVPSCRQLLCALSNQKGEVNYVLFRFPSITYLHKQKIVGVSGSLCHCLC